jgi:hypothetical protein
MVEADVCVAVIAAGQAGASCAGSRPPSSTFKCKQKVYDLALRKIIPTWMGKLLFLGGKWRAGFGSKFVINVLINGS